MFNTVKKTFAYGDHQVTIETGEIARQAGGAVLVSMEETVVLLRDAAAGMEVLLLRRHAQASTMAGIYVFPGGKLDEADRIQDSTEWLDQPCAALHARLGEPGTDAATATGLHVAVLREALEECGLLLAEPTGANQAFDVLRARAMLR